MSVKSLQELLAEPAEVEIRTFLEIIEQDTEYDQQTEIRRWLSPIASTSGTYSYTTKRGEDKDKDDEGGKD